MKLRHLAAAVAATALTVSAPLAAHAATPHAGPADTGWYTPSAQARAAGITAAGGAYMGWSQHRTASQRTAAAEAEPAAAAATNPHGIDVSSYQGNVDWGAQKSAGKSFAYIKATEGTSYTNAYFSSQYTGSYNAGFIRGSYHFAQPASSSGTAQADYFVAHGGGWSSDGKTLPGALDIEYNPSGATCYGLSQASMRSWISAFSNEYHAKTSRWPVIYSTLDWWSQCTGNTSAFAANSPLWIARYASSAGTLPAGWSFYTFWQYSSSPIDQDVFNGASDRLVALAKG